jgi:hypothetical protein
VRQLSSEDAGAELRKQANDFVRLHDSQVKGPIDCVPIERSITFAEDLILCLTERDVVARINADRGAALAFRIVAYDIAHGSTTCPTVLEHFVRGDQTQYFLLASVFIALRMPKPASAAPSHSAR